MKPIFLSLLFLFGFSSVAQAQEKRSSELYVVIVDDKRGYIDRTGKIVIKPQFAGATDFADGLAFVILLDKEGIGFIDRTGTVVIRPRFPLARNFSDGLAFVYDSLNSSSARCGYIDKTGKVIWKPSK